MAGKLGLSWLLTLPAAGLVGAGAAWVAGQGGAGTAIVVVALIVLSGGAYVISRRDPVTARNVVAGRLAHSPAV